MLDELYEAHSDDPPFEGAVDDPMIARGLLIEYQRNDRKAKMLARTALAVAAEYKQRLQATAERQDAIRDMLRRYVEANGNVSFPEVGGVHKRIVKPKLVIADEAAFEAWCFEEGYFKRQADFAAAKSDLAETGEIPPGTKLEPESTDITIRKA